MVIEKSMKLCVRICAFALCLAMPIVSLAARPVAVWDRDFTSMTQGTYTLNENGNTKTDTYLQISGDNGILFRSTEALNTFTVIARCEGLNLNSENGQVLFTSFSKDEVSSYNYRDLTGVYLLANNTECHGIWSGAASNSDGATKGSVPVNYTTLIFNNQPAAGTYVYALGPTSGEDDTVVRTTLYIDTDLHSSAVSYYGFNIGGLFDTPSETFLSSTGLKITSLAVFSGTLTEAEMKGYFFPSEVPVFNVTVSENKTWSDVLSDAGVTEAENARLVITAENNPKITFDGVDSVLYGLTVNGSAAFLAGDAVYGSGAQSFGKTLLSTTMDLSLPNVTFEMKDGWKGSFVKSTSDIKLYAQNAETISINIGGGNNTSDTSDKANLVSDSNYYGLYPTLGSAWNNISGQWQSSKTVTLTSAKAFDGETTTTRNTIQLSGTSGNTWLWTGTSVPFLRGYLDDTAGIRVQIVGVPYSEYDVIVYATSDSDLALNYFTINDKNYTCGSDGIATEGTSSWGVGKTTTPTLGKNAMLVQGVTGSTLTISGTRAASAPRVRVTVCAVQIINKGVVESSDWSANLDASTTFSGGTGSGLSGQSGTWVNSALASITVTNKASDATLTLDGEITAGSLKIVGDEGNRLTIAKDSDATLDIAIYDLTETEEETTFLFDPDFSKVNAGANLIGVGYDYTGAIVSGCNYTGSDNTLTLGAVNGGSVVVGGAGTISGDLGISGDATVTFSGDYTSSGNVMLGATKGVLNIAEGASVSVPHVRLVNSGSSLACTMNVDGALTVTSESTSSNVYNERGNYKGILFGHYYGSSTVNVGATGSIIGEAAWMQLTYTAPNTMTIDGGAVKVRGINGGTYGSAGSSVTLTGGGTIEVAEGFVNMGHITRDYGYGTIKTYSYDSSTGWTDPGAISFTDTDNGTTIDPCGMNNVFSGVLSGVGKIVVSDSVGGGSVSFTGAANDLTGDIVVGSGVTLNLGTNRPEGEITVDAGGVLAVVMTSKVDTPVLKVSSEPANVILYDIDGVTAIEGATVDYNDEDGTITVKAPMPRWTTGSNSGSFDADANWSTGSVPTNGDAVIELSQDTTISISETYTLSSLTITGTGMATLSGAGTVTADTVYVVDGATLAHSGQIKATEISLASGTVLSLTAVQEDAAISGAGAVETYGAVTFNASNTFTGGLTVKPGSTARTIKTGIDGQAYGKNNYGQDIANLSRIVVEDGGSLDLANTADACYAITIAGNGVNDNGVYKGALFNSGAEIGQGSRQTASLTLSADAMVKAELSNNGWGIVNSGHAASVLALNGHTLTVSGAGYFPIVNANTASGTQTTGTLVADGVTLGLVSTACNLTGVDVIAKGCATIRIATAPSALGSLTIKPSNSGTTATAWALPDGLVPKVDTSNIDYSVLTDGQVLTIFTAPSALSTDAILVQSTGRFTTTIDGATVKATFNEKVPKFLHYDFNDGATAASDSGTSFSVAGEGGSASFEDAQNGKAVHVHTGYTPYWDTFANGTSPFHAGEVTVTTVAKMAQTGVVLWGLGNTNNSNPAMGLAVLDPTTAAVYARNTSGTVEKVVEVSVTEDLTKGYHFYAVVASAEGTTLYVDGLSASSDKVVSSQIGQQGQLGSFHGGVIGSSKVGDDGYYLDDWRVYDTALTAEEVAGIMEELFQTSGLDPASGRLEVTSTEETEDLAEADAKNKIVVPAEAEAAVNAATYAGYFIYDVTGEAGAYTVAIVGIDDDVVAEVKKNVADAIATGTVTEGKVTVAVKPGLYYGFDTNEDIGSLVEPELTLATGTEVQIAKPGKDKGFVNVRISVIPAPTND